MTNPPRTFKERIPVKKEPSQKVVTLRNTPAKDQTKKGVVIKEKYEQIKTEKTPELAVVDGGVFKGFDREVAISASATSKVVSTTSVSTVNSELRENYVRRHTENDIMEKRTVIELKREQDGLKRQYETLRHKLVEIKSAKNDNKTESTDTRKNVSVGYYSTSDNFERTGKSEYLTRIPMRSNKFDEEEVETALNSLKHAIDDLQRQIDKRGENN